ncbi:ribosomal-processing cysteine protease Prp [Enterococcus sp. BWB1-3]|uniref:ribosomal-processing cysteine protease Prp n=1 Tax=Enterococcus sp. BWB1-3 TaxID=2787713 RepID=UPI001922DFDC|nr:ribosomal-processing cysteine protease Prp [Enterococcus sp. BWB1-3]MBL1228145.1 ribosomal-processing cysteine protease Prp [Enterococcus sp. BWB1-3]
MIKAKFKAEKEQFISYQLTGHANHSEHGTDIVCSAVSALFVTISNMLMLRNGVNQIDNLFIVSENEDAQLLTETLYQGLQQIAEQYPDNVKVITE